MSYSSHHPYPPKFQADQRPFHSPAQLASIIINPAHNPQDSKAAL
jgi:hypothetical protein